MRTAFPFAQRRIVPQSASWPGLLAPEGHSIDRQSCQLSPFAFPESVISTWKTKQGPSNASLPLFLSFLVSLLAIGPFLLYYITYRYVISSSPPGPIFWKLHLRQGLFPFHGYDARSIANSRRPSSADFFLLLLSFFQGSNHFLSPVYLAATCTADGAPHNQQQP